MRFHSAGRSLRWGADDECIVRLISASKKCGGYGHQRCACAFVCSLGITQFTQSRYGNVSFQWRTKKRGYDKG